jgi:hypothetical protein
MFSETLPCTAYKNPHDVMTVKIKVDIFIGVITSAGASDKARRYVTCPPCCFCPEGGVGLVPKRGCLLMSAYYAFPR